MADMDFTVTWIYLALGAVNEVDMRIRQITPF